MRRPIARIIIKKRWPIFLWTRCDKCGFEVRREWMWKIYVPPRERYFATSLFFPRDICKNCAPTKEDVEEIVNERINGGIKPPPPPCPPLRSPHKCA